MNLAILAQFEAVFGCAPSAIGQAPGRVNLIGEHIDYNGGTVLPMALPNVVDIAIAPNGTNRLRIISDRFEGETVRGLTEKASGHWSDYVLGSFAKGVSLSWGQDAGAAHGEDAGGFDILVQSTVPSGGVSSSAALCTAMLRAMMAHAGAELDAVSLAKNAREIENDFLGIPCGIMDQMAVGLSRYGEALAINTRNLNTQSIPIPEGWQFITLHSGVHRKLTDGRYGARFAECAKAREKLGIGYLCDASLEVDLPPPLAARTRHVVTEQARVLAAIGAMKAGDLASFGALMNESHRSYAEDFEASALEIETLLGDARALGAIGARLTGGGFGGCVVLLSQDETAEALVRNVLARHPKAWRV